MDNEDITTLMWQGVLAALVLAAACFVGKWIVSEKKVDGYYLSKGSNGLGGSQATCVYAHWTWHHDELSFCTNNYQEALEFVERGNASVRK